MTDQAFQLLHEPLRDQASRVLWIVDENISEVEAQAIQPTASLSVLSNRYDISMHLKQKGFDVVLSDFELCSFPALSFDVIAYRVSKEKALVHHIINSAGKWLKPGGTLYLAGFKNDGIKTYASKAADYLGEQTGKQRGDKTAMRFAITTFDELAEPLDDKNYAQARLQSFLDTPDFYSKPGIFGWDKIDKGSAFLAEYLPDLFKFFSKSPATILDLGCGYGYLSLMASRLSPARITATDNNIAAASVCRKNFEHHSIRGEVILDDCAEHIEGSFDLIICNPPFHQGFDVEGDLTDRFLSNTHRLLKPGGKALFVVNAFIPLERKASSLFNQIETVANNRSFKLIVLS